MNAFLDLAERQIAAPRKAQMRAAEKRTARKLAMEKALDERDAQLKAWRAWRRERVEALLSGLHGQAARELCGFLDGMTLASAGELVEFVRRGPWRSTDADTRFEILSLIDAAIIMRENIATWPPFDDALPFSDEKPTAFQIIERCCDDPRSARRTRPQLAAIVRARPSADGRRLGSRPMREKNLLDEERRRPRPQCAARRRLRRRLGRAPAWSGVRE